MKSILEKFPKALLIDFMCSEGGLYRFETKERLEGRLLYHQWLHEEKACECERAEISRLLDTFKDKDVAGRLSGWKEYQKKSERNTKRYNDAQKLYEKSQKLRGFLP